MTISKELLTAKLAEAVSLRDERLAQYNSAVGAVNTLQHLLAVADLEEPKPRKDPVPLPSPPGR